MRSPWWAGFAALTWLTVVAAEAHQPIRIVSAWVMGMLLALFVGTHRRSRSPVEAVPPGPSLAQPAAVRPQEVSPLHQVLSAEQVLQVVQVFQIGVAVVVTAIRAGQLPGNESDVSGVARPIRSRCGWTGGGPPNQP
jgi:hypothetical protein